MYDQGVHDQVNLARLVRRLEKSVAPEEWNEVSPDVDTWLKAERVLQRVKFARKLLKNCEETGNTDPKKSQLYEEWRLKLEGYETTMNDIHARATPTPKRPPPILPSIPVPKVPSPKELDAPSVTSVHSSLSETGESGPVESLSLPANDLLLSPSDTTPLPSASLSSATPTLIPSNFPSSSKSSDATAVTTGVSRFLQNSNSLHQELSEQLAQMAVQLKRNALHFSDSLVKDKAVVEDAQQKVESNFDVMQKERIRLRDHRGKSTSTTCLVVAIILVVVLLFALMVVLIRLTRII